MYRIDYYKVMLICTESPDKYIKKCYHSFVGP